MYFLLRFFAPGLFILLLTGCGGRKADGPPNENLVVPRLESPQAPLAGREQKQSQAVNEPIPVLNLGSEQQIVKILDSNLDEDTLEEQVIIALPVLQTEQNLVIYVVDYNEDKGTFSIEWQADLSSRNLLALSLRREDVTGNGAGEIVISGFDERGRYVMDIFTSQDVKALRFHPIFNQVVKGNIEINQTDRPPDYERGEAPGNPYSIIVQEQDPEAENTNDLIENLWEWNPSQQSYILTDSKSIQGQIIEEERLKKIYEGDAKVVSAFLGGAWIREGDDITPEGIVFFDPKTKEIIFFDGTIQEIFEWTSSHKTTAKRLHIQSYNKVITSLRRDASLIIKDLDFLEISMPGNTTWNGSYQRLGSTFPGERGMGSSIKGLLEDLPLAGSWRSPGGTEFLFDLPQVTMREGEEERHGSASLFSLEGRTILQIQFMKKNAALEETLNWMIQYEEDRDKTRVIRSLTLTPAILNASGIQVSSTPWRRFEQIEVISSSGS